MWKKTPLFAPGFDQQLQDLTTDLAIVLFPIGPEPGIQGDRVSGARKPATLETGLTLQVPLFVNPGDRIKVDTRSGEYITRA